MKVIGLTGGIGSGKSTVARVFNTIGVPVFYADDVAKNIYETDAEVLNSVKKNFGIDVFDNGSLDKMKLGNLIFSDVEKMRQLNSIVHPAVRNAFRTWMKKHPASPYVIIEAAILIESGTHKDCDEIILVTAPQNLRISRVMKRDGVSETSINLRMKNQWTDEEKRKFTSIELVNDETELLIPQILKLHERFLSAIRD